MTFCMDALPFVLTMLSSSTWRALSARPPREVPPEPLNCGPFRDCVPSPDPRETGDDVLLAQAWGSQTCVPDTGIFAKQKMDPQFHHRPWPENGTYVIICQGFHGVVFGFSRFGSTLVWSGV